jgi:hypothetical protein
MLKLPVVNILNLIFVDPCPIMPIPILLSLLMYTMIGLMLNLKLVNILNQIFVDPCPTMLTPILPSLLTYIMTGLILNLMPRELISLFHNMQEMKTEVMFVQFHPVSLKKEMTDLCIH